MKKISAILSAMLLVILSSCSLQENMSPENFIQRLTENIEITVKDRFFENEKFVCYLSDINKTDFILEIDVDPHKNAKKICLACLKTDKTDDFKSLIETVVKTYAPNENVDEIVSALMINDWDYYSSRWYRYSSAVSDNGLFFSVESVKLSTETDAEMTLKTNDINP